VKQLKHLVVLSSILILTANCKIRVMDVVDLQKILTGPSNKQKDTSFESNLRSLLENKEDSEEDAVLDPETNESAVEADTGSANNSEVNDQKESREEEDNNPEVTDQDEAEDGNQSKEPSPDPYFNESDPDLEDEFNSGIDWMYQEEQSGEDNQPQPEETGQTTLNEEEQEKQQLKDNDDEEDTQVFDPVVETQETSGEGSANQEGQTEDSAATPDDSNEDDFQGFQNDSFFHTQIGLNSALCHSEEHGEQWAKYDGSHVFFCWGNTAFKCRDYQIRRDLKAVPYNKEQPVSPCPELAVKDISGTFQVPVLIKSSFGEIPGRARINRNTNRVSSKGVFALMGKAYQYTVFAHLC
jgi:hypothetical protein